MLGSTGDHTLEKVTYKSFGENVYALLRIPADVSKLPVVVILPAASINKENDAAMASALCSMGYATLTLDERGNQGETPGPFAGDLNSGFDAYINGGDPVQYRQVYDALAGLDYIKTRKDLDGSNVAIMGESMGGRFAIIAGALEPQFKAVYVVSSSGYGNKKYDDPEVNAFIASIEPANYLSRLSPGKLIMFHFKNDTIIPAEMGKELFDAASEPKALYLYDGDVHGLYNDMLADDLRYELKETFGR
nr:acetylxylan esterase [Methanocella sp. CWC-04]